MFKDLETEIVSFPLSVLTHAKFQLELGKLSVTCKDIVEPSQTRLLPVIVRSGGVKSLIAITLLSEVDLQVP